MPGMNRSDRPRPGCGLTWDLGDGELRLDVTLATPGLLRLSGSQNSTSSQDSQMTVPWPSA